MTYEETLNYLYSQLPMFTRIGAAAYKEDLHNTIALCKALDNPQEKITCIHVAGTNGKGSTSHMLAAVLQKAGYKTGLYTSPHIREFGERIRINGKMIEPSFVVDFTERTRNLLDDIQPSFFELTVAMAFDYFVKQKVDIAVIETGLGGRLDSTNVITPILSVITNIGYDHMQLLGNTLEQIASEKAGIIKQEIPVVIGETHSATQKVFIEKAADVNAPIVFADQQYTLKSTAVQSNFVQYCFNNDQSYSLDLLGQYQSNNLRTTLTALDQLKQLDWKISTANIQEGLRSVTQTTGLQGRWQLVREQPKIILDVAHNQDGIDAILTQLKQQYQTHEMHFVLGFVQDKDVTSVLKLFPNDAQYYFTNAHIPRALHHESLMQKAKERGLKGESFDQVNDALNRAIQKAQPNEVIMVCGSFFILSEIN